MIPVPKTRSSCAFALAVVAAVASPCAQINTAADRDAESKQAAQDAVRKDATSVPNAWFEITKLDLGTFLEGETAVGKFPFKNPHDETHQLSRISPNCQCAKARIVVGDRTYVIENDPAPQTIYRVETDDGKREVKTRVQHIVVAPKEEGYVEIQLNLKNIRGKKDAYVSMHTTDEKLPMITVSAGAKGVDFFNVVPPEINLNKMTWNEKREFSFEISSEVVADFELVDVETTAKSLEVASKTKSMRGDKAVWRIQGSYGPDADPNSGGGVIKLKTDVSADGKTGQAAGGRVHDVRVIAFVDGPMTIRPGTFLPLGRIKHDEGISKVVEFEPNDDFDLQITGVELTNLTIDRKWVEILPSKDGKICKIELKVAAGAPRRLIRGDIKVMLNHPAIEQKELQFNGFVR